ncbi:MAG: Rieske 2Fe-2S domain-containing protein [Marinosulfonomonas sp.]
MTIPVALSIDLPPKRVMRTFIDGKDIVVWRSTKGELSAWENRCPHRGMRLSHGFVRGENLACLYHGWHYGKAGKCTYIPAHPDMDPPETIQPARYGVAEQNEVIWVSLSAETSPETLPDNLVPLRSFTVTSDRNDIVAAIATSPFKGTPVSVTKSGANHVLCQFETDGENQTFAFLFNQIKPGTTVVQTLVDASCGTAEKSGLSRWCERLRRTAETLAISKVTP